MKVALIANLRQNAPTWPDKPPRQRDTLDSWETVQSIALAMEHRGHRVTFLEGDKSLYNNLEAVKPDVSFNLFRGHPGPSRAAQVPAMLDLLGIPYTGSSVLTLALAEDKPMSNRILIYHGLPAPAFQVFEHEDEILKPYLHFPLWIRSGPTEASLDVGDTSIVYDINQLRTQLRRVFDCDQRPVLVEQYLEGRCLTVGMVGNLDTPVARHIPADETAEHIFQGLHIFPPTEIGTRTSLNSDPVHSAKGSVAADLDHRKLALLPENRIEDLKWLAAVTFRVIGCLDVASVDFQLDANDHDKPYIVNINPLPSLDPYISNLYRAASANGWTYEVLINHILAETIRRHGLETASLQSDAKIDGLITRRLPALRLA